MQAVGFTFVRHAADVVCSAHFGREDLAIRLLSFSDDGVVAVVLIGRLHYREEQLRILRSRISGYDLMRSQTEDADLARSLYKARGIDGLCRLEGDFALVCHDRAAGRMFALRDPLGAYPLFWVGEGGRIGIGTAIRPLLDLVPAVELDHDYMVEYLSFPTDFFSELPVERTAYRHVQRLLPGSLLEADTSTGRVTCRRCFDWSGEAPETSATSLEAAGEAVRGRLAAAVAERLSPNGRTGAHFSGGFDSTGLALLADDLVRSRGGRLHALSLIYERDAVLSGEDEYMQCALQGRPNIVHHKVPADGLLDFDAFEHVPLSDEPSPNLAARHALNHALTEAAAHAGADTVLMGDGADYLFAPSASSFIADHVRTGNYRQAVSLAVRSSEFSSASLWRVCLAAVKPMAPARLRDGLGFRARDGRAAFEDLSYETVPPWFTKDFANRHQLRRRVLDRQRLLGHVEREGTEGVALAAGGYINWHIGLPNGVVMTRPYWDPRVVMTVLGLPRHLHLDIGRMKPVLAAALKDVLPEKILSRRNKENYDLLNGGLSQNRSRLEYAIRRAPIEDGVLDVANLLECLQKASLGLYKEAVGVGKLRLAVSYLLWASTRGDWLKTAIPSSRPNYFQQKAVTPAALGA